MVCSPWRDSTVASARRPVARGTARAVERHAVVALEDEHCGTRPNAARATAKHLRSRLAATLRHESSQMKHRSTQQVCEQREQRDENQDGNNSN